MYLRPDAWPMQVVGPNGDSALTKPAEAAELHSEFVSWVQMDSWVRMESPFTSSNRSSSPSSSDTSSPPPSRPAPDQPAAASQVAGLLARWALRRKAARDGLGGPLLLDDLAEDGYLPPSFDAFSDDGPRAPMVV